MNRLLQALTLALTLLLAGAGACDRSQTGEGGEASGEPRESDDSGREDGTGTPCERDMACDGYLRCIEGTCQEPPAVTGKHDEQTPRVRFYAPAATDADVGDAGAEQEDADAEGPLASFFAELATTPAQRRRGLMHRREMKQGWGMLFVYPDEQPRSFWMKNTYLPLDMVFMDRTGKVVNVVESAEPLTQAPRRSEGPARFVLELSAGVAAQSGIQPGVRMRVENVPDEHTPDR